MRPEKHPFTLYPHVIPDMEDWPIYLLHQDRRRFIEEIDDYTVDQLMQKYGDRIGDVIAKTAYKEKIRMKEEPWKVDPSDERLFWKKIQSQLGKSIDKSKEESEALQEQQLRQIVHRYSEEIVGTFKIKTFKFARRFLTLFFSRLLNTAASRNFLRIFNTRHRLYQRLIATGFIEEVRELMKKGTVVIMPTHSSNLDSIMIGYVMDVIGLPAFSYGAGLNLYNTGYTAYFMNRLGAYRVDRRKKNQIYLEVLKAMSVLATKRGTNTLFFPGGTRSRSGSLETHLKMGLMGTVIEAQRGLYEEGKEEKIFIVPMVISYHVVLEAKFLIEQHLRRTGRERYIRVKDDFYNFWKIIKFAWNIFSRPSAITVSFGKPMDVVGNFVDKEGESRDQFGNPVNVKDYFLTDGKLEADTQRESVYTRMLADRIVERFLKDNVVLCSHLVAFAAFTILRMKNPKLDLYALLRLPTDDVVFPMEEVEEAIDLLKKELQAMSADGDIRLSEELEMDTNQLIIEGVKNLGVYHPLKALKFNKQKELVSDDFKLLYFYHNRLDCYELEKSLHTLFDDEMKIPVRGLGI